MTKVCLIEGSGRVEASKGRHRERLTEAYNSIPKVSPRKLAFRCRGGTDELVNFDIFAFHSKFIRSIALSFQNVFQLNSLDPCPVILLPETSPGIIRKVESFLQTGTCVTRWNAETREIFEVADMLCLHIGSEKKTSLPTPKFSSQPANPKKPVVVSASTSKSFQGSGKATYPAHLVKTMSKDTLSTPNRIRSGASLTRGSPSCLSEESQLLPLGNGTPDDRSRRDSIMSNCGTPSNVVVPVDEFLNEVGDSRPDNRSHKKPLTTAFSPGCNYELTCEVCGKAHRTALSMDTHMCAHFKEDLMAKVSCYMTEDNKCKMCGDSFKTKSGLVSHLGSKHGGINKVLVDKGFSVLPCRVNSSGYTDSKRYKEKEENKQQQLVKIKAEKMEEGQT